MNSSILQGQTQKRLEQFESEMKYWVASDVEFVKLIEEDLLSAGGKRIRPRLVFLVSGLLGWTKWDMEIALAVELFHSASLLHDDLIDDAETRRGHEAAFRKYGNAVSVLSGDFLLSRQLALLAKTGSIELVAMFAQAAKELTEGEVLQFQVAALEDYSLENYERIINGKTAALMRLCCEGVAALAEVSVEERNALAKFGQLYGQAFQMRDDFLDLMGDAEKLGKPVGSDVREGKLTAITLLLLERFPNECSNILSRRADQEGDEKLLVTLAEKSGIADEVSAMIENRVFSAIDSLDVFSDSEYKRELVALVNGERVRLR